MAKIQARIRLDQADFDYLKSLDSSLNVAIKLLINDHKIYKRVQGSFLDNLDKLSFLGQNEAKEGSLSQNEPEVAQKEDNPIEAFSDFFDDFE